jgi:hypothetical protein
MLFARAITRGARRFAPGIFGGAPIYTPEELGADTDEDGNLILEGQLKDAPAESQPPAGNPPPPAQEPATNGKKRGWSEAQVKTLVDNHLAENAPNAVGMLNLSNLDNKAATSELVLAWGRLYRGWRDKDLNSEQAAAKANLGEIPE